MRSSTRWLALVAFVSVVATACAPAAPSVAPTPQSGAKPAVASPATTTSGSPSPVASPSPSPAAAAGTLASVAKTGLAQPAEATLLGSWFAQPEEGGYYLAENEGLYKARNVNMTIKPGGPGVDPVKLVAVGQFKFGMAVSDQVALARNEGVPVVGILAPFQKYAQIIMVHEESGIKDFDDISRLGTRVAVSSAAGFSLYLRKKFNWKDEQILRYNGQIAEWLNDKQRATQGLITNEPYLAKQAGANPRSLLVADVGGYNAYQKMLFTTEDTIKKEPELVTAVVQASVEGWRSYMQSPDKTNVYLKTKNPDLADEQMKFAFEAMKPLVLSGDAVTGGLGVMSQARWDELYSQLKSVDLMKPDLDAKAAWADTFYQQATRK